MGLRINVWEIFIIFLKVVWTGMKASHKVEIILSYHRVTVQTEIY